MKNQMNKTYLLIDPRDQNPEGTVELTLDDFVDAGGNLAALRGEAGAADDLDLIRAIDLASRKAELKRQLKLKAFVAFTLKTLTTDQVEALRDLESYHLQDAISTELEGTQTS